MAWKKLGQELLEIRFSEINLFAFWIGVRDWSKISLVYEKRTQLEKDYAKRLNELITTNHEYFNKNLEW